MTIETQSDLTISGVRTIWSDYTNFGGVFLEDTNNVLTKEGPGTFIISGEQGYALNTKLVVKEGVVQLKTNPFVAFDSAYFASKGRKTGQNLEVEIQNLGTVLFDTPKAHIRKLNCTSSQTNTRIRGNSQILAKEAQLNGRLWLDLPTNQELAVGDSFQLFTFGTKEGRFSEVHLPDFNGTVLWDTSSLYSQGKVKVSAVLNVKPLTTVEQPLLFPNPTQEELCFTLLKSFTEGSFLISNAKGQRIKEGKLIPDRNQIIKVKDLPDGLYFLKVWIGRSVFMKQWFEKFNQR
jgi:hypothetical protein